MSYDANSSPICEADQKYLTARGVPVSVAADAGLFSADDEKAAKELGFDRPLEGGALVIPYFDGVGNRVAVRARLRTPHPDGPKFLTPAKTEVRPYLPPATVIDRGLWAEPTLPLVIVEGAIKALSLSSQGIAAIGLGGVLAGGHDATAWRERKEPQPHSDIAARVELKGRKVTVVFDAGRAKNPMVALGEAINAAALEVKGADVFVAALPFRSDGADQGPDDYLATSGVDALWALLDVAKPANPLKRIQSLAGVSAAEQRTAAAELLVDLPFLATLHVGGEQVVDAVQAEFLKLGLRVKTEVTKRVKAFRDQLRAKVEQKKATTSGESRPAICITVDNEMEIVDQAEEALSADVEVFRRGNALVRVCTEGAGPRFLIRERGAPRVEVLPLPTLEERLSAHAEWLRKNENGEWVAARPPSWAVNALANRPDWPNIRPMVGVAESPVFRPDGRVVWEPGYDADTGLLLLPVGDLAEIPDHPTLADAQVASQVLLAVVDDFPFASEAHRAAWLAALLTPFAMFAYSGCAPLVVLDANIRGSGKTLLVEIIGIITTGRGVPRMANTVDDSEMRKRLLGLALASPQIVLIDNIDGRFGTPSLDMALTAGSVSDRVLGLSKIVTVPLRPLWLGTGNNVQLVGDMGRRVLPIRLESPLEKPEERSGFKHPNLVSHVRQERPRLVAAALTILRAFHLAGRPAPKLRPWGSFEAWQELVCGAISWLGLPDPSETRVTLSSSDAEGGLVAALIAGWEELDPSGQGVTAAEAIRRLEIYPNKFNTLRDALSELVPAKTGSAPDARALGYALRKFKGRVVGGRKLELRTGHQSTARWYVAKVGGPGAGSGGDGGHGGDASEPDGTDGEMNAALDLAEDSLAAVGAPPESPPSPPSPPAGDDVPDVPF